MPNANDQLASQWLRQGAGIIQQELQRGVKAEDIQRRSAVQARIVGEIMPAQKRGELDGRGVVKAIHEVSSQFGVDPLDGLNMYNNVFKVAQQGDIDINEQLESVKLDKALSREKTVEEIRNLKSKTIKNVADAEKAARPPAPEKAEKNAIELAYEKIAGDEALDLRSNLNKIRNIALKHKNAGKKKIELIIDELGDLYEGAGIESWGAVEWNEAKDVTQVVDMIVNWASAEKIPGFNSAHEKQMKLVLAELINSPQTTSPDDKIVELA